MLRPMKRRDFITGGAALAAAPAWGQTAPRVVVQTAQGAFVLELAANKAPITTANFLRYVNGKRFDGVTFYRALRNSWAPETGLVQGGLQNDPRKLLPPIAHESTTQTGLSHKDGVISMARHAPGTATSDFFICLGDMVSLDADPNLPGDNLGFAAFGRVVEGMDAVRAILAQPTSATKGDEAMRGQILDPPVAIASMKLAT